MQRHTCRSRIDLESCYPSILLTSASYYLPTKGYILETSSQLNQARTQDPQIGTEITQEILGACPHDCPDTCSIVTTVKNGIAIKVQGNPHHPNTHGVLCNKVSKYTERSYHPDRVLTPLKRVGAKGQGLFEPVSWDEALKDVATRLQALVTKNPWSILPYSYGGTLGAVQGDSISERIFNYIGTSDLDRTICASAGAEGMTYTLGAKLGTKVEQFANSDLIIIWGSNSITSNLHFWRYAQEAKRKGAKLICIDPRKTETADKCHQHIAILPGTDAALALSIMHQLISNNDLDHDYIQKYTLGFEMLRQEAMAWPPEKAASVCGISVQEIQQLAQEYGACYRQNKAAAIRLNYGMQRTKGGGNAVRAVLSLPALIGAWRHAAGGALLSSSSVNIARSAALQRPDLATSHRRVINMTTIGDDLLRPASKEWGPAIEAMIIFNSNPASIAPESGKVIQGLAREDLFTVVLEHFLTDTTDYADYVFPATTQLEHWDIHKAYGHTDVVLNQPAIAPVGQAKSNTEFFRLLAKEMGLCKGSLSEVFLESDESLCQTAFAGGVDWSLLLQQGFVHSNTSDTPFANGNFPTPSGKCEFYSERLAKQGLAALPSYIANYEVPGSDPRYPLAMISPPARNFLNTTFVNVESLLAIEGEPYVEISQVDAEPRGIQQGDVVRLFNDRGSYICRAHLNHRARSGVVNALGIWWRKISLAGTNVNELTSQKLTDLGRAPVFYDCLVEIEKLNDQALQNLGATSAKT